MVENMLDVKELLKQFESLCRKLEQDSSYSDEPLPVELCSDLPCIGTPEEMSDLIKSGYQNVLRTVLVKAVVAKPEQGIIATKDIPMVQIASDNKGCAMCKDGECLLWNSGLTPLMGKLHLIRGKKMTPKMLKMLIHVTISQWSESDNASAIHFCINNMKRSAFSNHTN